ncbi:hypothetical protein MMPV_002864 [Pyropia vietnamensis]
MLLHGRGRRSAAASADAAAPTAAVITGRGGAGDGGRGDGGGGGSGGGSGGGGGGGVGGGGVLSPIGGALPHQSAPRGHPALLAAIGPLLRPTEVWKAGEHSPPLPSPPPPPGGGGAGGGPAPTAAAAPGAAAGVGSVSPSLGGRPSAPSAPPALPPPSPTPRASAARGWAWAGGGGRDGSSAAVRLPRGVVGGAAVAAAAAAAAAEKPRTLALCQTAKPPGLRLLKVAGLGRRGGGGVGGGSRGGAPSVDGGGDGGGGSNVLAGGGRVAIKRSWCVSELRRIDGLGGGAATATAFALVFGARTWTWVALSAADRATFLWATLSAAAGVLRRAPRAENVRLLDLQTAADAAAASAAAARAAAVTHGGLEGGLSGGMGGGGTPGAGSCHEATATGGGTSGRLRTPGSRGRGNRGGGGSGSTSRNRRGSGSPSPGGRGGRALAAAFGAAAAAVSSTEPGAAADATGGSGGEGGGAAAASVAARGLMRGSRLRRRTTTLGGARVAAAAAAAVRRSLTGEGSAGGEAVAADPGGVAVSALAPRLGGAEACSSSTAPRAPPIVPVGEPPPHAVLTTAAPDINAGAPLQAAEPPGADAWRRWPHRAASDRSGGVADVAAALEDRPAGGSDGVDAFSARGGVVALARARRLPEGTRGGAEPPPGWAAHRAAGDAVGGGIDGGGPPAAEGLCSPLWDDKEADLRLPPADLAALGKVLEGRTEGGELLGARLKAAVSSADAAVAAAALTADKDVERHSRGPDCRGGAAATAPCIPSPDAKLAHLAIALVKQPSNIEGGGLFPFMAGATEAVASADASLCTVALQQSNVAKLAVSLDELLAACTLTDAEASVVDGALAAAENGSRPPPSPVQPRHHHPAREAGDSQSAPSMRLTDAALLRQDHNTAATEAGDAADNDEDGLQAALLPAAKVLAAKTAYEPTSAGIARMHAVAAGRAALERRRGRMVAVLLLALRRRADGVAAAAVEAATAATVATADRRCVQQSGHVPAVNGVASIAPPRVRTPSALATFGTAHGCLVALCPRSAAFLRRAYAGAAAKALPAALKAAVAAADAYGVGDGVHGESALVSFVGDGNCSSPATAAVRVAAAVSRHAAAAFQVAATEAAVAATLIGPPPPALRGSDAKCCSDKGDDGMHEKAGALPPSVVMVIDGALRELNSFLGAAVDKVAADAGGGCAYWACAMALSRCMSVNHVASAAAVASARDRAVAAAAARRGAAAAKAAAAATAARCRALVDEQLAELTAIAAAAATTAAVVGSATESRRHGSGVVSAVAALTDWAVELAAAGSVLHFPSFVGAENTPQFAPVASDPVGPATAEIVSNALRAAAAAVEGIGGASAVHAAAALASAPNALVKAVATLPSAGGDAFAEGTRPPAAAVISIAVAAVVSRTAARLPAIAAAAAGPPTAAALDRLTAAVAAADAAPALPTKAGGPLRRRRFSLGVAAAAEVASILAYAGVGPGAAAFADAVDAAAVAGAREGGRDRLRSAAALRTALLHRGVGR